MNHQPGQILQALVNGEPSEVYLTLSELDVDGKPRWRYAPSQPLKHEIIAKGSKVEIIGPLQRFKDPRTFGK